jgi:GT2 family glycosyltransferase
MLSGKEAFPVSVLICSRDRRDMLDALIADLQRQDYSGEVEIIVVEETDDPRPPEGCQYVPLPVRGHGIAYARNLAMEHASHEIIVFVDDDCRVGAGWLRNLVAPFADTAVLGVQGGVTVPDGSNAIGWAESLLGFPGGGTSRVYRAAGHEQSTMEVSTLNAAYRRSAVDQVGGFSDAARQGGEDYILAKRVAEHGRLLFVPNAMVRHVARGSLPAIWRWFVRRGRAEIGLLSNGVAPPGYGKFVLRSSLGLKLLATLLLFPWFGCWPIALLAVMYAGMTWWRHYPICRAGMVPLSAWMISPLVKGVMDIAVDAGRISSLSDFWRPHDG